MIHRNALVANPNRSGAYSTSRYIAPDARSWESRAASCGVSAGVLFGQLEGPPKNLCRNWYAWIPTTKSADGRRVDWAGTAAFALFAGATTFAVVRAGEVGWGSSPTMVSFALAVVGLIGFVFLERRVTSPLIDLRLFRRPEGAGRALRPAQHLSAWRFGCSPGLPRPPRPDGGWRSW